MNRFALLAATGCLIVACGSDFASPDIGTAVGTWSLSTYDGGPLPVTLSQNALGKVEFMDDALTLTSDLKYTETGHLRATPTNGTPSTTAQGDVGTYRNDGGAVTLTSTAGNGVDVGTIVGTKMTIIFQGHRLVYLRGS